MITPQPPSDHPPLADGVLVINLDQRPERLERFGLLSARHPAFSNWQRMPGVVGTHLDGFGKPPWFHGRKRDNAWGGRAGCVLSHRKAIETALAAGWNRVCILEDDVDIPESCGSDLDNAATWLSEHQDLWDVAYLGFTDPVAPCLKMAELPRRRGVYRISGCATTHAYLLKREVMEWILAKLPDESCIWPWIARNRAIDRWYSRHLARRFQIVAFSPSLIGQISDFSDIGLRNAGDERAQSFYESIPSRLISGSRCAYAVKYALSNARVGVMDTYDGIRGSYKKLKGF